MIGPTGPGAGPPGVAGMRPGKRSRSECARRRRRPCHNGRRQRVAIRVGRAARGSPAKPWAVVEGHECRQGRGDLRRRVGRKGRAHRLGPEPVPDRQESCGCRWPTCSRRLLARADPVQTRTVQDRVQASCGPGGSWGQRRRGGRSYEAWGCPACPGLDRAGDWVDDRAAAWAPITTSWQANVGAVTFHLSPSPFPPCRVSADLNPFWFNHLGCHHMKCQVVSPLPG
jgi:hypothetical protein